MSNAGHTPQCAFLVRDAIVPDDALAAGRLRALGWEVVAVPWRQPAVDWRAFDLVVIRSTWDYHLAPDAYLAVLATVAGQTRLANPFDMVSWNSRKTYLKDLAARGVPIVPTVYRDRGVDADVAGLFRDLKTDALILKPVVGASASGTRLLRCGDRTSPASSLNDEQHLIQPLVRSVLTEGEYSVFFFGGRYSHTVLKTPGRGDFRVQEEHGGRTVPAPPDLRLLEAAERAMEALESRPLYARVDLVRAPDGEAFWLMELELIEPVLYLGMDIGAPERLACAIVEWPNG
jgi:glutathione synthase/RimK-type ligase-like ATP-grasp enzyme